MSRHVRRRIVAVDADHPSGEARSDALAVEEPLEIRVNGAPFMVTMRTPGHDIELVHGLLAAEGIVARAEDIATARFPRNRFDVLEVRLAEGVAPPHERTRATTTTASCGVCGTPTLDALRQDLPFDVAADDVRVSGATLLRLPGLLREAQRTFSATGGLHGVALFEADGRLLVAREDVGRHNATDTVLGWALLNGRRPARGCVLMVSGRTSFELAQKAALAGVPVLAGVSAPSSLAVDVAEASGVTLAGFVRGDRMNLYAHAKRITLG